ncbi:MAG TPA: copper resistance protein CopC, partial [Sphingomonadaceae bacterium]|nr:copper resistance protein CopC [Sphingomonadaceae bacterium]
IPATASTQLIMTAMPGMANHANLEIKNFTTNWSNSNKTLTINLKNKLKAGTYEARWQGAGADGHRMSGTVHFDVG